MNMKKIKDFFSLNEPENFDNNLLSYSVIKNNNEKKYNNQKLFKTLEQNEQYLKSIFNNCYDLTIRKISLYNENKGKIAIAYLNEFTTEKLINDSIINKFPLNLSAQNDIEESIKYTLAINDNNICENFAQCIDAILDGNVIIFSDMLNKAFIENIKSPPERSIEEPNIESTIRGPREGFTESMSKNIILLRKKIKNINLKTEKHTIGKNVKSNIVICYMEDAVDKKILEEVKARIRKINIDTFASNYVLEAISDDKFSLVPTIFKTERPDVAASKLLEGKILILVDNTPIVLSIPALFVEFMQASDDYYTNYIPATLNRCFRYIGLMITLTLPGIYVALVTFHHELIPTPFITTIIKARAGIPLPSMWECFLMLSAYEIIREAGLRIPKTIGQTVSIVGTLILGEAAARAGIVSEPMIIVVAFVGTALYTIPSPELNSMILFIRYIILLLGGALGIFGVLCGLLFLITYMTSRRSFGVPYMYPIMPFSLKRNEDVIVRTPIEKLDKKMKLFRR
ncbi:spore germination protein KA [Clostridium pasteurianum DSM 525 = ATCC 6013]|uniref:GerA spore germination protein n=2 Tax=Clostridium pasteurianum TaxID=1501 RepID=A0A0H3J2M7_CLOPA|nr:spore germination protein KA [Clostridium pasteurianum DSM 525 = ATCC 6013]AJA50151.1 spore germination protein KA [Clostridium pasteurianum DSM 525 = ATCC 6013]AOZ73623.1 spore gernimation protein GerK [Clostridium pasteurianum DSM 525 = ATCC 6013]AOZ77420.1 spore gernimation protein GerK [Clostridium pasteurianum]KRU13836.1 GerA spore germination protein [Clostridium pasteurianum DSM 525 = ATCC 6013]